MVGKTVLGSDRVPRPLANYSQAVQVGDLIFLAGQLPTDFRSGLPEEVRIADAYPYYGSAIEKQTRMILQNIKTTLEDCGSSLDHVVKTQVSLMDCADFDGFDRVWKEFFPVPPPRTAVQIGEQGLLVPGSLLEIDVIAVPTDSEAELERIPGDSVPKPLANYTPCTRHGDWLFLAGQLPTDFSPQGIPAEAKADPNYPYYASDIERQTDFTLRNLKALLEESGSDLDHVVKAHVFLRDLRDFNGFDEIWKRYFDTPPPRSTVQIGDLLVKDALLEIDLIAVTADGSIEPEVITVDTVPQPLAGYTQALRVGEVVFLAGQLATDFRSSIAPEAQIDPQFPYYGSAIEKQTDYILGNCQAVLEAAGSSLDQVVKAHVFLTDLDEFYGFDKIWKRWFEEPPARTAIQVAADGLLIPGALVEIDLIGAVASEASAS